jgi:hypothetical protein
MGRAKLVIFILIFNLKRYNLHLPAFTYPKHTDNLNGSYKAGRQHPGAGAGISL